MDQHPRMVLGGKSRPQPPDETIQRAVDHVTINMFK
jgi:hypothetical protein